MSFCKDEKKNVFLGFFLWILYFCKLNRQRKIFKGHWVVVIFNVVLSIIKENIFIILHVCVLSM